MALHSKDAKVFAHGYDVSAYFRSMAVPRQVDTAETSTFGTEAKTFIPGLTEVGLSGDGLWDGAANAVDAVLAALLQGNDKLLAFFPGGDAIGSRGVAMRGQETNFEVTADIGDAVGFSFEANGDDLDGVVSLMSADTVITGTGNQATHDNAAQTTAGGVAYLHCVRKTGGSDAVIEIRHSTDNFAASDDSLALFTLVDGIGQAERLTINGTIRRYVRAVVIDLGSGGTWQFSVCLKRN